MLRLPQDLHEQIIAEMGGDGSTLARCALVCWRWLHYSRKQFFTTRSVNVSADELDGGIYLLLKSSFLAKEANNDEAVSTLAPYILEVCLCAPSTTTISPEERDPFHSRLPNLMIQYVLTQCLNLRKLTLESFKWDDISAESLNIIHTLSHLEKISFREIVVTCDQLVNTLENLQPSITVCHLRRPDIRGHSSNIYPQALLPLQIRNSVKFHVGVTTDREGESPMIDFFLRASGLNICSLDFLNPGPTEQQLMAQGKLIRKYSSTLKDIRSHLGYLAMNHTAFSASRDHISLFELSKLQSLDVGIILSLGSPAPGEWLSRLLRTLPSSSVLSRLACALNPAVQMTNSGETTEFSYYLRRFNWKLVEDVLMDPSKFASEPPCVEVTFLEAPVIIGDGEREMIMRREMQEMERYMERIYKAGKLRMVTADRYIFDL